MSKCEVGRGPGRGLCKDSDNDGLTMEEDMVEWEDLL